MVWAGGEGEFFLPQISSPLYLRSKRLIPLRKRWARVSSFECRRIARARGFRAREHTRPSLPCSSLALCPPCPHQRVYEPTRPRAYNHDATTTLQVSPPCLLSHRGQAAVSSRTSLTPPAHPLPSHVRRSWCAQAIRRVPWMSKAGRNAKQRALCARQHFLTRKRPSSLLHRCMHCLVGGSTLAPPHRHTPSTSSAPQSSLETPGTWHPTTSSP